MANKPAIKSLISRLKECRREDYFSTLSTVACKMHREQFAVKDGFYSHYKATWPKRVKEWLQIDPEKEVLNTGVKKRGMSFDDADYLLYTNPKKVINALERTYLK